jgi:hypothetical protein
MLLVLGFFAALIGTGLYVNRNRPPKQETGWFIGYRTVWYFTHPAIEGMGGLHVDDGFVSTLARPALKQPYPFPDRQSCEAEVKYMKDSDDDFKARMAELGASADLTEGIHEVSLTHSCIYTTGTRRRGGYGWEVKQP